MLWFIGSESFHVTDPGNLNTSYVMVHPVLNSYIQYGSLFKYILCYGSSESMQFDNERSVFKYILCYGSSRIVAWLQFWPEFKYILCYGSSCSNALSMFANVYLNTSYVMVHLSGCFFIQLDSLHLNTSYVMVHLVDRYGKKSGMGFKYILCYGSV